MSEERADAQLLRRKDDEHVSMFKARAGMGGVIMEGQEISAVVRYIEALEARVADAPAVPEGFALVPLEPPIDMVVAAERWLVNLQHMRAADKREAVTQALRAAIAATQGAKP